MAAYEVAQAVRSTLAEYERKARTALARLEAGGVHGLQEHLRD